MSVHASGGAVRISFLLACGAVMAAAQTQMMNINTGWAPVTEPENS
jgi:hypothetical protein